MEEEKIDPVACAQVVAMVKEIGTFMLCDRDGCHYLITEHFVLQLKHRDAWKIQCKLEIEKRNVFYQRVKSGWTQSPKAAQIEAMLEKYQSWTGQAKTGDVLTPTGVEIVLYEDTPVDGVLYAGGNGYALIRENYLAMLTNRKELVRVGEMVVVNGSAVVSLMQDEIWQENSFVVSYGEGK